MQLQKRSKFEEIVNNKPIKIITKPDYTDVSNDFHISNIRDFDYDIEKQILDNKKELIQSDLLNEITTRMQRKDEKIKNVLDKTNKETQANLTDYIKMNSDNSSFVSVDDPEFSQENIDMAMKLAEEARKQDSTTTKYLKVKKSPYFDKKQKKPTNKGKSQANDEIMTIQKEVNVEGMKLAEEARKQDSTTTKYLKVKKSPHFDKKQKKPTNKGKSQANDEIMTIQKEVNVEGMKLASQTLADKIVGDVKQQIKEAKAKERIKEASQKLADKIVGDVKQQIKEAKANDESMAKQMEVDAPTEKVEGMNIDTSGVKRVADDTKEEIMKRARQGEFIPNFKKNLNVATKAMIQQQMIMQGIPFDETHKKSVLKDNIRYSKWTDAVEENTIKKRLEEYKAEHGFLPIENVQDTASSSKQGEKRPAESSKNEPKAKSKAASSSSEPKAKSQAASSSSEPKAKSQAASSSSEPKAKSQAASSSGDPKPMLTLPKGEQLKEEDEPDIRRYQQTPILSPKRASKNIGVLTENLKTASQRGLITGADLVLYNTLGTAKEIQKIKNKAEKQRVMDNLTMLYKKYVYEPSLKSFNLSPKSGQTGVKKTIQKEK